MTTKAEEERRRKAPRESCPESTRDAVTRGNDNPGLDPEDPSRLTFLLSTGTAAAATMLGASVPALASIGTSVLDRETSGTSGAVPLTLRINDREHKSSSITDGIYNFADILIRTGNRTDARFVGSTHRHLGGFPDFGVESLAIVRQFERKDTW